MAQTILVVDFGGQYNQLIARRVRKANVYCELISFQKLREKIAETNPIGLVFTGGPASFNDEGAPRIDADIFDMGIPVLGICYGCQLLAAGVFSKSRIKSPSCSRTSRLNRRAG